MGAKSLYLNGELGGTWNVIQISIDSTPSETDAAAAVKRPIHFAITIIISFHNSQKVKLDTIYKIGIRFSSSF